jgi:hypothetical protein
MGCRRKEYLRQKDSGVSKITDKEKALTKCLQSVTQGIYRHPSHTHGMGSGTLGITSCFSMERWKGFSVTVLRFSNGHTLAIAEDIIVL